MRIKQDGQQSVAVGTDEKMEVKGVGGGQKDQAKQHRDKDEKENAQDKAGQLDAPDCFDGKMLQPAEEAEQKVWSVRRYIGVRIQKQH